MAATVSFTAVGRSGHLLNLAAIPLTIDANSATYATATGGLPFDLFAALAAASPQSATINPKDVIDFTGISAAGYVTGQFAVGTTTSTTCPCTVQLWNGTTEFSDGACTQVITGFLWVARNGAN